MKTLLASVVGGIILFMWGFLAWVVLPLHNSSIRDIPGEEVVLSALVSTGMSKGAYLFPGMNHRDGMTEAEEEAARSVWTEKHKRGPVGIIVYDPVGVDPDMPLPMVRGVIICILAAFVVAWMLVRSTAVQGNFVARVAFCGMFGIFLTIAAHLVNWNWMYFPLDYTIAMSVDSLVGWTLAGMGIAAVIKPSVDQKSVS